MGYPVDQATLMHEQDRLAGKDPNAVVDYFEQHKGAVKQTKEEQDKMMSKLTKHAQPIKKEAVVSAGFVDFSKSVEDQDQLEGDDVRKQVMGFPVPCVNCEKMGVV